MWLRESVEGLTEASFAGRMSYLYVLPHCRALAGWLWWAPAKPCVRGVASYPGSLAFSGCPDYSLP